MIYKEEWQPQYDQSDKTFYELKSSLDDLRLEADELQMQIKEAKNNYFKAKAIAKKSGSVIYDAYNSMEERKAKAHWDKLEEDKKVLISKYRQVKKRMDQIAIKAAEADIKEFHR